MRIDAGQSPSIAWQFLAYGLLTASEVMVSIVGLEFAYTQSPRKMKSFIMGLYLLSVFAGNALTGIINLYIEIPTVELTDNQTHPGFDNKTNTEDDLLLTDKQIKSPVYDQLTECAAAIESIYQSTQTLPTTEKGAKALGNFKDPWGNPLRYTLISSSKARIASSGPDGEALTQWDLGVMVKVNKGETEEKGTWLDQEKEKLGLLDSQKKTSDNNKLLKTSYYAGGQTRLEGSAYFWFFTILMLVTSVIFIPFSLCYKTKTYLQE